MSALVRSSRCTSRYSKMRGRREPSPAGDLADDLCRGAGSARAEEALEENGARATTTQARLTLVLSSDVLRDLSTSRYHATRTLRLFHHPGLSRYRAAVSARRNV